MLSPSNGHEDFVRQSITPLVIRHRIVIFLMYQMITIEDKILLSSDWPSAQ